MDTAIDLSVCARCHCLVTRRSARAITRIYDDHLRPHGLRATQFSVLVALALGGPSPIGELADALGLERTTLTRSAALLEKKGWVAPDRSDDRREHPIRLTAAGRRRLEAAFPAWKRAQELAARQLGGSAPSPFATGAPSR
jgi:DNA-binding MarR family transcriptional regulator